MRIAEMNAEQKREYNRVQKRNQRERTAAHRERKRIEDIEAQEAASERAVRASRNLHFFGEESSGRDAQTCADELQIHREFLRAMGKPDVQEGETLRIVARRTLEEWFIIYDHCYGPPFYVPS